MTRVEFEAAKSAVHCSTCGAILDVVDQDIPPPHDSKLVCSKCGRFSRWLAKEPERLPPGYQDQDREAPPNWARSKKGNLYRKLHGKLLTVFEARGGFKWVCDGKFSDNAWESEWEACEAAEDEFT